MPEGVQVPQLRLEPTILSRSLKELEGRYMCRKELLILRSTSRLLSVAPHQAPCKTEPLASSKYLSIGCLDFSLGQWLRKGANT